LNLKRNGNRVIIYGNGRIFKGNRENDLKHGAGFELFPNESYYEGIYVNGKTEGTGTHVYLNEETFDG